MRLANGIVIDKEATFGALKFSALRREVHLQNEDGSVSEEIKERTYDLKSRGQGRMIQVSIPASVPLKEFDYKQIKGRGYVDVGTSVISEFYTPLVPKGHDFLKEIKKLIDSRQGVQAACGAKAAETD